MLRDVATSGMPTTAGDYLGLWKPPERPEPALVVGRDTPRRGIDDDARGLADETDRLRLSGGVKFVGGCRLTAVRWAPVVMCVHPDLGPCVLDDPCDSCLPDTVDVICAGGEVRVARDEFLGALRREPPTWKDATVLNKLYVERRGVVLQGEMYLRQPYASQTARQETTKERAQRAVDEQAAREGERRRVLIEGPKESKPIWRNPASANMPSGRAVKHDDR